VVGGGGYLLYRQFSHLVKPPAKPAANPQDTKANLTRDLGGLGFDLGKYVGNEIGGTYGSIAGSAASGIFSAGLSELGSEIFS